jgi:hypothetical protein
MKLFTCLAVMMFATAPVLGKQTASCDDPYALDVVQQILISPTGMASGFGEKQMNRLGDRASVAVVKIFSKKDLTQPSTIRQILPILRAAFGQPKIVGYERDRRPDFTLILLRYLSDKVKDPELGHAIEQTTQYINLRVAEYLKEQRN